MGKRRFLLGLKKRKAKVPRTVGTDSITGASNATIPTEEECRLPCKQGTHHIAAKINLFLYILKNKLPSTRPDWVDSKSWEDLKQRKEQKRLTKVTYFDPKRKLTIRMPDVYHSIAVAAACRGNEKIENRASRCARIIWCRKGGEIGELGRTSSGPCLTEEISREAYLPDEKSYISFRIPMFVTRDRAFYYLTSKKLFDEKFPTQLLQRTISYYISREAYQEVKWRGGARFSTLKITPSMSFADALHKAGEETLDFYETEIAIMEANRS